MTGVPTRRGLIWVERALFLAGLVCLGWVLVTWQQAASFQRDAMRRLNDVLATGALPELPGDPAPAREHPPAADILTAESSLIGVLDIPRLGVSVAVMEGTDDAALRLAAGHLPDTPLPWDPGNTAVAGHRDTFFRPLQRLRIGDDIVLSTRHGVLHYRVRHLGIVGASDVWVLRPGGDISLTLITCYPFTFIGPAPDRFVVQAARVVDALPRETATKDVRQWHFEQHGSS